MKTRLLIWILVILALIQFATAATCEATGTGKCYYVSNKAGSGSGTFANPYGMADLPANNLAQCQLSSAAIQPLQPGDILYFIDGTYQFSACTSSDYYDTGYIRPARSGSQGSPITFKAYPGDTVTFNIVGNQGILGNSGFSDIKFEGFILNSNNHGEGAIEIINGNRVEVNRMQVIGSYAATSDNHDGIRIEQASNVWVHNSIIQGVTGGSENSAGIKLYVDTGTIVEDNYIHDNTAGVYDKDSGKSNTYRRNFFTRNSNSEFLGNNQGTPGLFYIYDNVLDGEVNLYQLNSGSQIHDNLIRGNTLAGGYAGKQYNLNLWNNIVISKSSSVTAYYDDGDSYVQSGSSASLAYMDYNLYDAATQYRFGTYAGSASTFTQQDMKAKGFEQNSQVQSSSSIFADEVSYNILPQWKAAGRYADQIGPDNISLVLDTTRYGPGGTSSNTTQPPADTTPPALSNGQPTGTLAVGTTTTTMNVTTNEAATCRYSTTTNTQYASMTNTFTGTATAHSATITGLVSGNPYIYHVRCNDTSGNMNTYDYSVTFSITSPPLYPNEPSGFTKYTERPFNTEPPNGAAEDGWTYEYSPASGVTIANDSTAPKSPPNVGQALFPKGFASGSGPVDAERFMTGSTATQLYMSFWVKFSSNWYGNDGAGVNKIFFIWIHGKPAVVLSAHGAANGPLYPVVATQDTPDGGVDPFQANVNSNVQVNRGQWQRWEVLLKSNTAGNSDGTIKWWVDGNLIGNYNNVIFSAASDSHAWENVAWNPTYGGAGNPVPADQYQWIDHIYVSTSSSGTTPPDTTPPALSNGQPTGTLTAGTTSTTMNVTTNEAATCRYSTTTGTTYASMTNTFTTTGGTTHSKAVSGLTNNSTYHYYIRCNDTNGNTNTQDYPITFSVAAAQNTTATGQGDLNADGKVDFLDLVIVINDFRHSGAAIQNTKADINNDTTVNLYDFVLLTKNWGRVYSSSDTTPPTITLTSPAANSKVSGTITVSATASDNVGVAGVQFMVDGSNFGTEDTATPYSTSLVTSTLTNGVHTISARARDASSNTATATVSVTVNNSASSGTLSGLDFPGVGGVTKTMSFSFSSPISYPATYIWRVYPKQQSMYYTAFFYGNSGAFQGNNDYYGFHPYPNWAQSGTHLWEIASPPGGDWTGAAVVYNQWYQQAAVVYKSGSQTYNIFYWNWPDTTKNITHIDTTARSPPSSPAITVADAPWNQGNEEWYGYMRDFQFYDAVLTPSQISQEIASPGSVRTPWYLNINPTPSDISDKSGNNHNPTWIGSERPALWTG